MVKPPKSPSKVRLGRVSLNDFLKERLIIFEGNVSNQGIWRNWIRRKKNIKKWISKELYSIDRLWPCKWTAIGTLWKRVATWSNFTWSKDDLDTWLKVKYIHPSPALPPPPSIQPVLSSPNIFLPPSPRPEGWLPIGICIIFNQVSKSFRSSVCSPCRISKKFDEIFPLIFYTELQLLRRSFVLDNFINYKI